MDDARIAAYRTTLERLSRALEIKTIVPGHGAPGGPEVLDAQAAYHSVVRDAVASAAGREDALAKEEA